MSTKETDASAPPLNGTMILVNTAAALLGAAAGAKVADEIIGGDGLPSALAQIGGALLGGYGGKMLADLLREQHGDET